MGYTHVCKKINFLSFLDPQPLDGTTTAAAAATAAATTVLSTMDAVCHVLLSLFFLQTYLNQKDF